MSSIPEGVKMPEDRKSAAQREAEGAETVTLDYEGESFTLPADPQDWPTRAMLAFEEGKAFAAIKALIPPRRYQKLGIDDWPARKTTGLFEAFAKAAGLDDAGE
jgi:hypothetical protein